MKVLLYIVLALVTTWVLYYFDIHRGKPASRLTYAAAGILFPLVFTALLITVVYAVVFGSAAFMAQRKGRKKDNEYTNRYNRNYLRDIGRIIWTKLHDKIKRN